MFIFSGKRQSQSRKRQHLLPTGGRKDANTECYESDSRGCEFIYLSLCVRACTMLLTRKQSYWLLRRSNWVNANSNIDCDSTWGVETFSKFSLNCLSRDSFYVSVDSFRISLVLSPSEDPYQGGHSLCVGASILSHHFPSLLIDNRIPIMRLKSKL